MTSTGKLRYSTDLPISAYKCNGHVVVIQEEAQFLQEQPLKGESMANSFGKDILIQAQNPQEAASFYVNHLGFEITDDNPKMIGLHGRNINLFIEPGPALGPVLEITVASVAEAKVRLVKNGCEIVKDEPHFPRCYVRDPFGLIYNLSS